MGTTHKHISLPHSDLESGGPQPPVPQRVLDIIQNVLVPYEDHVPWEGVRNAILSPAQFQRETEQTQEKILSTEELTEILHVSRVTIFRYLKAGKIRAYKFGRRNLFSLREVIAALKNEEVPNA